MLSTNQKNRAVTLLGGALLLILSIDLVAHAQPAPEVVLDRLFRNESSAPNTQSREMLVSFKQWMGSYQRIRKEGSGYVAVFDSGSLPLDAKFKANGAIETMNFGCPTSKSLSLSDAPSGIRQALSKCAGFKS
ncbi:hypothetical protein [Chamaesiphon sp. OTE_75_metabat_556]|uniref:hypothetical protein n=1 Tax=Chamaesiphon sp. OTE_75_metabat_556 TaxID=2964692 RepID=UPI00286B8F55|nr:hypothetical protein [Chamaesiphon sp. OTE_75_metabat_556]